MIQICHIFGICTQSTNPLFRFVQYFLSLYFSRMNAMVYVNKINVFQKYGKFGNVPTTSGHFIKHLYLLFLNSDPYVHSIKWENIQAGILLFGRLPIFMVDEYFSNNLCSVWVFVCYRHLFYKSVNTFMGGVVNIFKKKYKTRKTIIRISVSTCAYIITKKSY